MLWRLNPPFLIKNGPRTKSVCIRFCKSCDRFQIVTRSEPDHSIGRSRRLHSFLSGGHSALLSSPSLRTLLSARSLEKITRWYLSSRGIWKIERKFSALVVLRRPVHSCRLVRPKCAIENVSVFLKQDFFFFQFFFLFLCLHKFFSVPYECLRRFSHQKDSTTDVQLKRLNGLLLLKDKGFGQMWA